jgi:hypothetical protein
MQKFTLLFACAALFLSSCDKNDTPTPNTEQSAYPGTYVGKYTNVASSPSPTPVDAVAVVVAENGGLKIVLTVGANASTFNATFTADNKLTIAEQNIFSVKTTGTGDLTNSDQQLGLILTPGNTPASSNTFRGTKQ